MRSGLEGHTAEWNFNPEKEKKIHYGLEQPKIQTAVLGHLLVR